jgi:osmoprotectant transport system substrate-binding protein
MEYADQFGLTWLAPSAFNNTYCLAMTEERAEELGVETVSDLQANADGLTFGATAEFIDRPDGLPGLNETYGEFAFGEVMVFDPGLKYSGLAEGELDVTTCFGTDGQIASLGLRVLRDDAGFWPAYNVAPVINSEIVVEDPYVGVILNAVTGALDDATMSALNARVDEGGEEPADVAFDYFYENIVDNILAPDALPAPGDVSISVSSKEFTEQYILGNMINIALQEYGYDSSYAGVVGSDTAHAALVAGEIDVYPEYTGTGYLSHLGLEFTGMESPTDLYNAVSAAYAEQFGLTWLQPTAFNNTYCLAMTEERAAELGVETVSDLQANADGLTFGATAEFIDRPDGLPGLNETYGEFAFGEVMVFDPGLKYSGLAEGELDVTTCFGTDGQIASLGLRVLRDDAGFWPAYNAAPVINSELLAQDPRIAVILNNLMAGLDDATMSALNAQVDEGGEEPADVAFNYLLENGLIR